MTAIEEQQAIIANNIANAATPGFKRQNCVEEGFYGVLQSQMSGGAASNSVKGPGGGVRVAGSYSDWREGTLSTTGDQFNVALSGPGFVTVQTDDGDRYTRGGRFKVDEAGQLATEGGQKVLGAGGTPIDVQGSQFEVDELGNVLVDGSNVGRLQMVEFDNPRLLSREDNGLYSVGESGEQPKEATQTTAHSGMLELSNVQMPYEMAQMISGLRAYGAYQKVINTSDESLSRLIDQVAMPA